jgi:hypothetical protein
VVPGHEDRPDLARDGQLPGQLRARREERRRHAARVDLRAEHQRDRDVLHAEDVPLGLRRDPDLAGQRAGAAEQRAATSPARTVRWSTRRFISRRINVTPLPAIWLDGALHIYAVTPAKVLAFGKANRSARPATASRSPPARVAGEQPGRRHRACGQPEPAPPPAGEALGLTAVGRRLRGLRRGAHPTSSRASVAQCHAAGSATSASSGK